MKRFPRAILVALLLLCAMPALADGPLYPVAPGSQLWLDANGDVWFCPHGGSVCVPLGDSEPPIEP